MHRKEKKHSFFSVLLFQWNAYTDQKKFVVNRVSFIFLLLLLNYDLLTLFRLTTIVVAFMRKSECMKEFFFLSAVYLRMVVRMLEDQFVFSMSAWITKQQNLCVHEVVWLLIFLYTHFAWNLNDSNWRSMTAHAWKFFSLTLILKCWMNERMLNKFESGVKICFSSNYFCFSYR